MDDSTIAAFAVPRGSETILVVHEDDRLRLLLQISLESRGYAVLAAADGDEALRLAELHQGPIALLIADVLMPRMNSSDLALRLAASRPYLNVLLLSGYPRDTRPDAGTAFLPKPFRPSDLVAKVHRILHPAPPADQAFAARPQPARLGPVQVPTPAGAGDTIH
jgi:two-component system cell cycle sensor histidine kinase/response regulator CckA